MRKFIKRIGISSGLIFILWFLTFSIFTDFFVGYEINSLINLFVIQIVAIFIFFYFYGNIKEEEDKENKVVINVENEIKKEVQEQYFNKTKEYIQEFFNSKKFLNALNESLPKGDNDKEHGFDYIPYLISSINSKRGFFERNAKVFFNTTVTLAILFSGILLIFSYILINQDSFGIYDAVQRLDQKTTTLKEEFTPASVHNKVREDIGVKVNALEEKLEGKKKTEQQIRSQIDKTKKNKWTRENAIVTNLESKLADLKSMIDTLTIFEFESARAKIPSIEENFSLITDLYNGADKAGISTDLRAVNERLLNIEDGTSVLMNEYIGDLQEVDGLILEIRGKIQGDAFRIVDILKRFFLGVIVVTFFLALLRFVSKQYVKNYNEILKADNDTLMIKKFYVGYKSSQSPEERMQIFKSLTENKNLENLVDSKGNISSDLNSNELLKEVIIAISKKL